VLAFTPQYLPGALEVFADMLVQSLRQRSIETTTVTEADKNDLLPKRDVVGGATVHRTFISPEAL